MQGLTCQLVLGFNPSTKTLQAGSRSIRLSRLHQALVVASGHR